MVAEQRLDQLVLIVHNRPGVLARIALVIQRFDRNIHSLRMEPLVSTGLSVVDIRLDQPSAKVGILRTRLEGLIDVQQVVHLPSGPV